MRATYFLRALILILTTVGCTQVDLPDQTVAGSTPVEASNQVDADITLPDAPEPTATVTAPVDAPKPAATATAPVETPEPTATIAPPLEALDPLSGSDAAKIYTTAVRQIYIVDHTFGGDPPDFSLVYIVTTTTDGTLLDAPATPPQKLSAEL